MNNKGFTLIEVLAVLVILSAIMGIALPAVSNSLERSKSNQENMEKKRVESAAEMFVADYKYKIPDVYYNNCYVSIDDLVMEHYVSTKLKGVVKFYNGDFTYDKAVSGNECYKKEVNNEG